MHLISNISSPSQKRIADVTISTHISTQNELMTNLLNLTQVFLLHAESICIYKVLHYAAESVITQLLSLISKSLEMPLHIMETAATWRPVGI